MSESQGKTSTSESWDVRTASRADFVIGVREARRNDFRSVPRGWVEEKIGVVANQAHEPQLEWTGPTECR